MALCWGRKLELESMKTMKASVAVAIAIISVLIILVPFVMVIHQDYTASVALEIENESTYLTSMTAMSRQYVLEFMQRLTERARNTGETLSIVGLEPERIDSYLISQEANGDSDGWLIYTSDGTLCDGDTADGPLFADTARKASDSGGCAVSDYVTCADRVRRIGVAASFTTADGSIYAVVFLYGESALNQMLRDTEAENIGVISVVDENADIIACSKSDSPWAGQTRIAAEGTEFPKDRLFSLVGTNDGKTYKACARALGINDWLIVYTVPKELFAVRLDGAIPRLHLVCGVIVSCLILLSAYSAYRAAIGENRMTLFKKKFMIATKQSARAAFEYNRRTDRLVFISESDHVRLPKPYLSLMELGAAVHPQDKPVYYQAVADLRGEGKTSVTVRVFNLGGREAYRWYHVTATRLTNKGEGEALTIGTVEDIDEQENERLILHEKATTDSLTGLANRAETEKAVNEQLAKLGENDHAVFALLDLDEFKDINDKFGHDCGDKALIFFAERLRATFRFGDILGRLGGDEFVVYMTIAVEKDVVERRLRDLMQGLAGGCVSEGCNITGLSCSAGCCVASRGDSFDSVYKKADEALYLAKMRGKMQFVIV